MTYIDDIWSTTDDNYDDDVEEVIDTPTDSPANSGRTTETDEE